MAMTLSAMGISEAEARSQLAGLAHQLGALTPDTFEAAAGSITTFPRMPSETAEQTERSRPARELLGVPQPAEELEADLRAREWLQRIATDLDPSSA